MLKRQNDTNFTISVKQFQALKARFHFTNSILKRNISFYEFKLKKQLEVSSPKSNFSI